MIIIIIIKTKRLYILYLLEVVKDYIIRKELKQGENQGSVIDNLLCMEWTLCSYISSLLTYNTFSLLEKRGNFPTKTEP